MKTLLDRNVIEAIANYIKHGLEPGSFTTKVLIGEYEESYKHAHELLKEHSSGQDIVANTIRFVNKAVPMEAHGTKEKVRTWINHKGLQEASDTIQVMVKVEHSDSWWNAYSL